MNDATPETPETGSVEPVFSDAETAPETGPAVESDQTEAPAAEVAPAEPAADDQVAAPVAATSHVSESEEPPTLVEPAEPVAATGEVTPLATEAPYSEPVAYAPTAAEPTPAEVPVTTETAPAEAAADPAAVPVAEAAPVYTAGIPTPSQQVVYVEAPAPFRAKGNRGLGVLIAVIATVVFAGLYAVADVLVGISEGVPASFDFVVDEHAPDFWAPVVLFLVGFVILVLIVNRAGWGAHVLGSLFVGAFVFFGSALAFILLSHAPVPGQQFGLVYRSVLFDPVTIVAGLLAREVALWSGFIISARGRRVKAKNVERRAAYDEEVAAKRAEYEQSNQRSYQPQA